MKIMKIMSFNTQHCLNFIEGKIDFELMAQTIKNCGADIVGLNEIRDKGESSEYAPQASILSSLTGLEHFYFAKAIDVNGPNPYGNALLSKYKITEAITVPVPDPNPRQYDGFYETRCLLKAKLEGGITIMVIHFGLNPDEQINAVNTVIENLENEKCILMGDFNVRPDDKVLAPIRSRMKDCADKFERELLSYPSDNPDRKIDYIFVSPDVEICEADIPNIVASDHRPHTATVIL